MLRTLCSLLIALFVGGCSSPRLHTHNPIPTETQTAVSQLYVVMTEGTALTVMKPVALDSGRVTWGGSGSGLLYFQVSPTQQFYLQIGAGPEFMVTRIGDLETKRRWIRDARGGMSVQ